MIKKSINNLIIFILLMVLHFIRYLYWFVISFISKFNFKLINIYFNIILTIIFRFAKLNDNYIIIL